MTLQIFANSYFERKAPKVFWRYLDTDKRKLVGQADFKKNRIYLNPVATVNDRGCEIAGDFYEPRLQFRLKEGEQYFLTLLHEIGHFKITKHHRYKIPAEYRKKAKILRMQYPRDRKRQLESAEDIMGRKPSQTWDEWIEQVEGFKAYLARDPFENHAAVEDWARAEFKKVRNTIASLLMEPRTKAHR